MRDITPILKQAFKKEFDNVDVSIGYEGLIYITIVSKKFDKLDGTKRLEWMRKVADDAGLSEEERKMVVGLYAHAPSEIFSKVTK